MNNGFNDLWPTTVYLGNMSNAALLNQVRDALLLETNLSNAANSFQSFDVLEDGPEILQKFRTDIVWPAFDAYLKQLGVDLSEFPDRRIKSWMTGVYNGYMIPAHNHSGASVSAVFYLMCEEQNKGGELILLDSRTNANRGYRNQFKHWFENQTYCPKTGEYLMFPSHVYHHTIPFTGSIRLAMPVDLFL
jgi:hypothetical protein